LFSLFLIFELKLFTDPTPSSLWPSRLSRGRPSPPKTQAATAILDWHHGASLHRCQPPSHARWKKKRSIRPHPSIPPLNRCRPASPSPFNLCNQWIKILIHRPAVSPPLRRLSSPVKGTSTSPFSTALCFPHSTSLSYAPSKLSVKETRRCHHITAAGLA
jgi:hypothetical protein